MFISSGIELQEVAWKVFWARAKCARPRGQRRGGCFVPCAEWHALAEKRSASRALAGLTPRERDCDLSRNPGSEIRAKAVPRLSSSRWTFDDAYRDFDLRPSSDRGGRASLPFLSRQTRYLP
jgi:hypothetical protein